MEFNMRRDSVCPATLPEGDGERQAIVVLPCALVFDARSVRLNEDEAEAADTRVLVRRRLAPRMNMTVALRERYNDNRKLVLQKSNSIL
jgi:hypothetical protein